MGKLSLFLARSVLQSLPITDSLLSTCLALSHAQVHDVGGVPREAHHEEHQRKYWRAHRRVRAQEPLHHRLVRNSILSLSPLLSFSLILSLILSDSLSLSLILSFSLILSPSRMPPWRPSASAPRSASSWSRCSCSLNYIEYIELIFLALSSLSLSFSCHILSPLSLCRIFSPSFSLTHCRI